MSAPEQRPDVRDDQGASAADLVARAQVDRQDWHADHVGLGAQSAPANGGNPIR
ncbi:hypothetical protein OV450_1424 [Actinobacteria bacterium OV450]|nr:hypothetical protein OV450_1424 [Actinobacteria bacterium OV450]